MSPPVIKYLFPCRSGCGAPANVGKSCCSQKCRDSIPTCNEKGCYNAPEPITYQGHNYAGYTDKCYQHGGRRVWEGEEITGPPERVAFVHTVKGWLQCSEPNNPF